MIVAAGLMTCGSIEIHKPTTGGNDREVKRTLAPFEGRRRTSSIPKI